MRITTREYLSTKKYGHERGLSCAFRQWRAESHCNKMHGYALAFEFVFKANELDDKNWVVDFGGLKELEQWLRDNFDHKTLIAFDDPHLDSFVVLHEAGLIDLVQVNGTGCEMFADMAFTFADGLIKSQYGERCELVSVRVSEHGANSAIIQRRDHDELHSNEVPEGQRLLEEWIE